MNERMRVMLATEGTYPYHQGGVSTWCHMFVDLLQQVDFVVYSIMMHPYITQKFLLRPDTQLLKVPLWGTEDPSEHLSIPFSQVYLGKHRTDDRVIREHFIPLFQSLIGEIITEQKDPRQFGQVLNQLHQYFREYDYRISFTSEHTWNVFKRTLFGMINSGDHRLPQPSVFDATQSLGWIYRFLTVLNTPVPKVDVAHSAAAAFCGIPCVLAKLQHNTPFLLTEHGVYMREQYLSLQRRGYSDYLSSFLIRLVQSITHLNYAYADQISPVCQYNTRWERELGADPSKIKVIYNGVNKDSFLSSQQPKRHPQPTVVSVARLDPTKDIVTLIQAAAIVLASLPDARFLVYGSISVPEYHRECVELIRQLGLEGRFILAGHTNDVAAAYQSGDLVVLSSITEGFPYSVVEAMMSGKAVVATEVGGVKEAIGECGLLVRPRRSEELASALLRLLQDAGLRERLGRAARERALQYFTVERALELYLDSYRQLANKSQGVTYTTQQRLLIDRGFALMDLARYPEAINSLRLAINEGPKSKVVPVLLAEIAQAYNKLGKYDEAFHELAKAETLIEVLNKQPA